MEFASKGIANAGLATGIIGTTLGVLNGGLGNVLNGMNGCQMVNGCSENTYVNRYEATLMQELTAKESENALLRADKYTDQKIVEAYKDLQGQIKEVRGVVDANKAVQDTVNLQQATYNAANTSAVNCMQSQIAQLFGITKLVVPNTSVCPGWGNVTITPAAATTASAG